MKDIFTLIDSYRDEMIEMQRRLIPMRSVSPVSGGRGEMAKAKFLEPFLKRLCNEVKWINVPHDGAEDGVRPNIIGKMHGKDTSRTTWLMAHMDVVPEGDLSLWETNPWEAIVKDGRIYGRGAEDNHQGLVSSLFALKAIKATGITPAHNIGIYLAADEENGSNLGIKYLLKEFPDLFPATDNFLIPDMGSPKGNEIGVAEKGLMRFRATVIGKQTHAAYPERGINANRVMAHFMLRIDELRATMPKPNDIFDSPVCTFEPTQRLQNVGNGNTVPGKEVQIFDCRIIPEYDFDAVFDKVCDIAKKVGSEFGVTIEIEKVVYDRPAPITSSTSAFFIGLQKAIKEVYGEDARPVGSSGCTVSRFLRYKGCQVIAWSKLEDRCHTPNEYCIINSMVGDAKVFAKLLTT